MGCSRAERAICGGVASAGMRATIGVGSGIDPEDIVHSRYIVLWGTNTIVTNLHYWPLVREAQRRGASVVVVDPVRTRTAEAADWHLQIAPASDAALALAMMHVMVRDGLVDRDYVVRHAVGFDALVERVRAYSPEAMAATVGLPAEDIERFAREYATTQPSLIRPLIGIEHHRNGAMQFRTLACLPVLSGAWRHRGGGLARSTHAICTSACSTWTAWRCRRWHKPGVRTLNMRDLGKDLCDPTLEPPIRALVVYGANPVVSMPNQGRIREGLRRDDLFTVVHDLFVTDTALYRRLRAAGHEPDRASRPVSGVGPSVPGAQPPGHRAAWRGGVEHRAVPPAGARHSAAPSRGCSRATSRCCARRSRADIPGSRASPTSGCGTRATRAWRNPTTGGRSPRAASPRRQARPSSILERCEAQGLDPLPSAGDIATGQRPAAHLREDAALPELRLRPHGAASPARRRSLHRAAPDGCRAASACTTATPCA